MINIRRVKQDECNIVLEYIKKIAEYEKLSHQVINTESMIYKSIFIDKVCDCSLIEYDNKIVGFALYFYNYSTFTGLKGLYLEDLFIDKEYRNLGLGKQVFEHLIKKAIKENCGRMEWTCLDWNINSIEFYKKMKAIPMEEWTTFRLNSDALNEYKKIYNL